jgi:hypothetical protein
LREICVANRPKYFVAAFFCFCFRHIELLGKIQCVIEHGADSLIAGSFSSASHQYVIARLDSLTGDIKWRRFLGQNEVLYSIKEKDGKLATLSVSNERIHYLRIWNSHSGGLEQQWDYEGDDSNSARSCQRHLIAFWTNETLVYAIQGNVSVISLNNPNHVSQKLSHQQEILHVASIGEKLVVIARENQGFKRWLFYGQENATTEPIQTLIDYSDSDTVLGFDHSFVILKKTTLAIVPLMGHGVAEVSLPETSVAAQMFLKRAGPTGILLNIERNDGSFDAYTMNLSSKHFKWNAHPTNDAVSLLKTFFQGEKIPQMSLTDIYNTSIGVDCVSTERKLCYF